MSGHSRPTGNTAEAGRVAPTAKRDQPRNEMRNRMPQLDEEAVARARAGIDAASKAFEEAARAANEANYALQQAQAQVTGETFNRFGAGLDREQKQYAADIKRAMRLGKQQAPDLHAAVVEARRAQRVVQKEAIRRQRAAEAAYNRLNAIPARQRTPEQRAEMKAVRKEGAALRALYTANGHALGKVWQAEKALLAAIPPAKAGSRLQALQNRVTRLRAANERAMTTYHDRERELHEATARHDWARGGMGMPDAAKKAENAADYIFQRAISRAELARMAGLSPNAKSTTVEAPNFGTVTIRNNASDSPRHKGARDINLSFKRRDGQIIAHVGYLHTRSSTVSSGAQIVRDMQALRALGVGQVKATAAGNNDTRREKGEDRTGGYEAWANLGFTGDLPSQVRSAAQARFGPNVTRVEQVMQQPGGRRWWRENGASFTATFDFSNPYSVGVLDRFTRALNRGSNHA